VPSAGVGAIWRHGPGSPDRHPESGGQVDGGAGDRMIERAERAPPRALEETDELGPAIAGSRRLDSGQLALDLAGQEHRKDQDAFAVGRRT